MFRVWQEIPFSFSFKKIVFLEERRALQNLYLKNEMEMKGYPLLIDKIDLSTQPMFTELQHLLMNPDFIKMMLAITMQNCNPPTT